MLLLSPRVDNRKYFTALLLALIAVAWLSLWLWGQSPYSRFLSHKELGGLDLNLDGLLLTPVFVAGWTLLTVAMMFPTSLAFIHLFPKMVRRRGCSTPLLALFL